MCMPHMNLNNKKKLGIPISVRLATNQSTKARFTGEFPLNNKINLTEVLQFEAFDVNLISVAKLTQYLNCSVAFYHIYCLIQDNQGGLIGMGF